MGHFHVQAMESPLLPPLCFFVLTESNHVWECLSMLERRSKNLPTEGIVRAIHFVRGNGKKRQLEEDLEITF